METVNYKPETIGLEATITHQPTNKWRSVPETNRGHLKLVCTYCTFRHLTFYLFPLIVLVPYTSEKLVKTCLYLFIFILHLILFIFYSFLTDLRASIQNKRKSGFSAELPLCPHLCVFTCMLPCSAAFSFKTFTVSHLTSGASASNTFSQDVVVVEQSPPFGERTFAS